MKTIDASLQTHLDGDVTTLATCWRIELQDSPQTILGFTNLDVNIVFGGVTYLAASGIMTSQMSSSSSLSVDNMDIIGVLDSSGITQADIEAKKYDGADVYIFAVNYKENPITNDIKLSRGKIGNIQLKDNSYVAEFRSLAQLMQQNVVDRYSLRCRVDLGSTKCGVTIASYTSTGTVSAVTNRRQFTDTSITDAAGYYDYGKVTWTSGNNDGYSMEVKAFTRPGSPEVPTFQLYEKMPYDIQAGDTYSVHAGCDKLHTTCRDKFSNIVNFRGEPFIPGIDQITKYGGQ